MKPIHWISFGVIGIAFMIIFLTANDTSTYENFSQAYSRANQGDSSAIHVVGAMKRDLNGEVIGVQTSEDKLSFSFAMIDNQQQEQQVFYPNPMPADMLRSEQVVVIGRYHGDLFVANKILLKCPSKYQEEKLEV